MTIKELKEMINLMEEHSLSEIEIEKEGLKIKIKREPSGKVVTEQMPMMPQIPMVSMPAQAPAPSGQQTARESNDDANVLAVRSPMVGTFYASPAPDAAPFTDMGQLVEEGQVVCIIEAMKLMNEIKSDVKGKIVETLVNNGDPVEFGQPLFALEPV